MNGAGVALLQLATIKVSVHGATEAIHSPQESCIMSQEQAKPAFGWENQAEDQGEDFALSSEAAEVPKACSLDNPECEACQISKHSRF